MSHPHSSHHVRQYASCRAWWYIKLTTTLCHTPIRTISLLQSVVVHTLTTTFCHTPILPIHHRDRFFGFFSLSNFFWFLLSLQPSLPNALPRCHTHSHSSYLSADLLLYIYISADLLFFLPEANSRWEFAQPSGRSSRVVRRRCRRSSSTASCTEIPYPSSGCSPPRARTKRWTDPRRRVLIFLDLAPFEFADTHPFSPYAAPRFPADVRN